MKMIAKGCTCKNVFTFPFVESDVDVIFITYQQDNKTVFEKELKDCSFSEGKISVILTQEDTLKLKNDSKVELQIRVKLKDGTVTKSKVIKTFTDVILKNEVI